MNKKDDCTDLNHKYPDAQVAEGDNCNGNEEVHHHHCHCVGGADVLGEGAGVDTWVIAQRAHKDVGHDGHHGEHPD